MHFHLFVVAECYLEFVFNMYKVVFVCIAEHLSKMVYVTLFVRKQKIVDRCRF